MIDNDSKQQVKIIELSTKQEARNTELGLQQIAKSEKKVNQLEKELDSVKKQSAELQRIVTSLKNTGQKDTPEYYKKVEESQALKDHQRNLSKSIRGQKGYQAMQKKMYGIDKKANIKYNDKGEAYLLNEQESGLYNSIKQSTQNTRVKKRVEDEFFKTEKTKNKLTGENNDKIKKVNQNLVDTNRVLNAFKAALVGFGLYKAVTGVIKSGSEATNAAITSAARMNVSAETAKAIGYFGYRLGGDSMKGIVEDVFEQGARLKEMVGHLNNKLPDDMLPAFGKLGITPEDIMSNLPQTITTKITDALINKYRNGTFKTSDEMFMATRMIFGDSGVTMVKAILNNPELNKRKSIAETIEEGKNFSSMPANFHLNLNDYNKATAELFNRLDVSMQKIADFFQRIGTPLINLLNYVLNFLSPDRQTKQKAMKDIMGDDGKYSKYLSRAIGKYGDNGEFNFGKAFNFLKNNNDFNDLSPEQQKKISDDIFKESKFKNEVTDVNRKGFLQYFERMRKLLESTNYGREALSTIGADGRTLREKLSTIHKLDNSVLKDAGNIILREALTPPIASGWASSVESSGYSGGVGRFTLDILVNGKQDYRDVFDLSKNENKSTKVEVSENTRR